MDKAAKDVVGKILAWLLLSSKDPEKISLTVKGAVATGLIILGYLGISGHGIDATQVGDSFGEVVAQVVAVVTAATALWGALRKLYLTAVKPLLQLVGIIKKPQQ